MEVIVVAHDEVKVMVAANDEVGAGQVLAAVGLHHLPLVAVGHAFPAVGLHHLPLAATDKVLAEVDHLLAAKCVEAAFHLFNF